MRYTERQGNGVIMWLHISWERDRGSNSCLALGCTVATSIGSDCDDHIVMSDNLARGRRLLVESVEYTHMINPRPDIRGKTGNVRRDVAGSRRCVVPQQQREYRGYFRYDAWWWCCWRCCRCCCCCLTLLVLLLLFFPEDISIIYRHTQRSEHEYSVCVGIS